jgi:ABC-2 type transport system ATP-binding protein
VFDRHLSGRDNLDLLAGLHGSEGAIERDLVLDRLRLTPSELDRPVRELSSGMTQKVGIVAALQHRPRIVLLDEPANRLDPLVHHDFCGLLREMAADGRTVLLSSHVLGEVQAVCDDAVLLDAGRVLRVIDVQDLRQHSLRGVRLTYLHPHEAPPELVEAQVVGRTVTGRLPAARPDLVRRLLDDPDVEDIELVPPSLDDLFVGLYDKERTRAVPGHR